MTHTNTHNATRQVVERVKVLAVEAANTSADDVRRTFSCVVAVTEQSGSSFSNVMDAL